MISDRYKALAYQKEALEVASVSKHIFEDDPVVVALACILFMQELRFDLLEFRSNIRVVHRESPEKRKVSESFIGLAMIDEVAWCLRDKRNHDAHHGTRDHLNASDKVSRYADAVFAQTYSLKFSTAYHHAQHQDKTRDSLRS